MRLTGYKGGYYWAVLKVTLSSIVNLRYYRPKACIGIKTGGHHYMQVVFVFNVDSAVSYPNANLRKTVIFQKRLLSRKKIYMYNTKESVG